MNNKLPGATGISFFVAFISFFVQRIGFPLEPGNAEILASVLDMCHGIALISTVIFGALTTARFKLLPCTKLERYDDDDL